MMMWLAYSAAVNVCVVQEIGQEDSKHGALRVV